MENIHTSAMCDQAIGNLTFSVNSSSIYLQSPARMVSFSTSHTLISKFLQSKFLLNLVLIQNNRYVIASYHYAEYFTWSAFKAHSSFKWKIVKYEPNGFALSGFQWRGAIWFQSSKTLGWDMEFCKLFQSSVHLSCAGCFNCSLHNCLLDMIQEALICGCIALCKT